MEQKKVKKLGGFFTVLVLMLITVNISKFGRVAHAQEVNSNKYMLNKDGWYVLKDSYIGMEGAPEEITELDELLIACVPGAEDCGFLSSSAVKGISSLSVWLPNAADEIVLGSEENPISYVGDISVFQGKATIYAAETGFVRGYSGDVTLFGDVKWLDLGTNPVNSYSGSGYAGNIVINGDVICSVTFNHQSREDGGFAGNVTVTGTVEGGSILISENNPESGNNIAKTTHKINGCEAGVFKITDGILSEEVSTTAVVDDEAGYRSEYQLYPVGWKKFVTNNSGNLVKVVECTIDDIPANAQIAVYGTNEPLILNMNVDVLRVMAGNVTVTGNVGNLTLYPNTMQNAIILNVKGDVNNMSVQMFRPNQEVNVTVTGTVTTGEWITVSKDTFNLRGSFSDITNMQILEHSEWNKDIIMKLPGGSLWGYQTVGNSDIKTATDDEAIGTEISIDDSTKIIKLADMEIKDKTAEALSSMVQSEEFLNVLNEAVETRTAKNLLAVDISIDTHYVNMENGIDYVDDTHKSEKIKELTNGLSLKLLLPEEQYDADAEYMVIREHEGAIEALKVDQKENELSFVSDKFSTFIVVKVEKAQEAEMEVKNLIAVAGDGLVTVNWDAVPEAKGYAVFLKRTNGEVVLVHNRVGDTSYTVTGLKNGEKVGFVVKAYGNSEWSDWSSTVWATPQAIAAAPANLKTVAGNGEVTVSWDAVPGAQIYAIFLKRENGEVVLIHNRVSDTSYKVTGLANGTTVGFVVKSYANKQWSGWSSTAWATPQAAAVVPTNLKTVAENGQVTVSWDAVPGAQVYAIFLKKANGEVTLIQNRVNGTTYTATGLTNGTPVGFVVKAYVGKQWSGWSTTAWDTPKAK